MSMDIAEIGFVANSDDLKRANDELDKMAPAAGRVERATEKLNRDIETGAKATAKLDREMSGLVSTVKRLALAFGAFFSFQALIDITNTWTDLNSRVKIAAGSMEAGAAVMERIEQMARRTYSSLTQTAESYLLNAKALSELGKSTQQQLDFTEALNNALVVSGAKGDRAASVTNAISKAMALGALKGEELNTVIQSGGRVSQALAEGLGVATTELRQLGADGKITSEVLFNALIGQLGKLREEADGMAATIGDAFVIMGNSLTAYIGKLDQATGVSSFISGVIITLADNLETVGNVALVAGVALVTAFGPTVAVMIGTTLVGAVLALNAAIMANPIGFIATAITTVIAAIWVFRDEFKAVFGVDVPGIVKEVVNFIIRSFFTGFEQIKLVWNTLPNIVGSAAIGATNAVIGALNLMIGAAIAGINGLIGAAQMIPGIDQLLKKLDPASGQIAPVADGFAKNIIKAAGEYHDAFAKIKETDYVGDFVSNMDEAGRASEAAAVDLTKVTSAAAGAGGAMDEAGKGGAKKLAKGLKDVKTEAELALEKMQELRDSVIDAGRSAFKSFFNDLKDGKSVIDSLGSALDGLADKLFDILLDQAFNGLIGGLLGGGAGKAGLSMIPGIGGMFAKGSAFGASGVIDTPTVFPFAKGAGVMGEAGPEAIMPLARGSDGSLGVRAANDNGGAFGLVVNIYNNNANDNEVTTSMDESGNLEIMIDKIVAGKIGDTSSKSNKAIRNSFGVRNTAKVR